MIQCLENPLKAVHAIARLERLAGEAGIFVFLKSDFHEFVEVRDIVRPDETVSAMFDPACTPDLSDGQRGVLDARRQPGRENRGAAGGPYRHDRQQSGELGDVLDGRACIACAATRSSRPAGRR